MITLIYESRCPKCRFLMHLLKLFDLRDNIRPVPWLEAGPLLKPFFGDEEIPHRFFAVDDRRCYEGRAAIGRLLGALYGG